MMDGWMEGSKGREKGRERRREEKREEGGKKGKEPRKAPHAEGSRQTVLQQTARGRTLRRNLGNSPTYGSRGQHSNFSEVLPPEPAPSEHVARGSPCNTAFISYCFVHFLRCYVSYCI